jgi:hypothetical protein
MTAERLQLLPSRDVLEPRDDRAGGRCADAALIGDDRRAVGPKDPERGTGQGARYIDAFLVLGRFAGSGNVPSAAEAEFSSIIVQVRHHRPKGTGRYEVALERT